MTKQLRSWLGNVLLPYARAWIRYSPISIGKAWLWQNFHWRPHAFTGRLQFGSRVCGNTRDLIQRHLYFFGIWEPDISHWIDTTLRPGDGFIDIGANIGYYSLLAAKKVGTRGVVVAIEASPPIYSTLTWHMRFNRRRNVRTVQAAAMAKRSIVRLFAGNPDNIGKTSTIPRTGECVDVQGLPLSEILEENEIKRARIIKIDVEGAELHVLHGLLPLLDGMRPDLEIVMEVSPSLMPGAMQSAEEIFSIMQEHGFAAQRFDNDYRVGSYLRRGARRRPYSMEAAEVDAQADVLFSKVRSRAETRSLA